MPIAQPSSPSRRLRVLRHHCVGVSDDASRPPFKKVLVANRGEIALRIIDAAAALGMKSAAIFHAADAESLHTRAASEAHEIKVRDPLQAYLDVEAIVDIAARCGADCLHPGLGFLSERADLAAACAKRGITFIGPPPSALTTFGDKTVARRLAEKIGVPVVPGSPSFLTNAAAAVTFVRESGVRFPVMLKAAGGGGGRGMRVVERAGDLADAFEACSREAEAAFGTGAVFLEQYLPQCRHIEVQVLCDAHGGAVHLYDRDCSVQQRHQKVVEVAPASGLASKLRDAMLNDAVRLLTAAAYVNAGTVEFLVPVQDSGDGGPSGEYFFIEANPRLQVEHTVTEEITNVDIVASQFRIASGASLADIGLSAQSRVRARGFAIQARVVATGAGRLAAWRPPSGRNIRVDGCAYAGYKPPPVFDPLLAKLVTTGATLAEAVARAERAVHHFHVEGVPTNLGLLAAVLAHPKVAAGTATTAVLGTLPLAAAAAALRQGEDGVRALLSEQVPGGKSGDAGVSAGAAALALPPPPIGHEWLASPLAGTIVSIGVATGDVVREGQVVSVILSMKMEHVIKVPSDLPAGGARIASIQAAAGDTVEAGAAVLLLERLEGADATAGLAAALGKSGAGADPASDLARVRPDLAEVLRRQEMALDAARMKHDPAFPRRVERRRARGQQTARENVNAICEENTFVEYGRLRVAGQRRRRSLEELIRLTPADGILTGIGCVNTSLFAARGHNPEAARALTRSVVMAYDYTVLAGTQGGHGHDKSDRILEVAHRSV